MKCEHGQDLMSGCMYCFNKLSADNPTPPAKIEADKALKSEWSDREHRLYDKFIAQMLKDGYITKPRKKARKLKISDEMLERFEVIYDHYPRKTNKQLALQKFAALNPDSALTSKMYAHYTKAYVNTEKSFIPHFATYLSQARWNDEIIEVKKQLLKVPMDDNELEKFAKEHGLAKPKPTETYFEYRKTLRGEINNKQLFSQG